MTDQSNSKVVEHPASYCDGDDLFLAFPLQLSIVQWALELVKAIESNDHLTLH